MLVKSETIRFFGALCPCIWLKATQIFSFKKIEALLKLQRDSSKGLEVANDCRIEVGHVSANCPVKKNKLSQQGKNDWSRDKKQAAKGPDYGSGGSKGGTKRGHKRGRSNQDEKIVQTEKEKPRNVSYNHRICID